jgi:hypothetical protein
VKAPSASTWCSAAASEPPLDDWLEVSRGVDCEGAAEDWHDPDEEVVVPVASIGAGSTALMLMLVGCTGSLVADDDAAFLASSRLSCDHVPAMFVRSIEVTVLAGLRRTRKSFSPVP